MKNNFLSPSSFFLSASIVTDTSKATSVAFAVFAQEPLDERRIVAHPLFVAVIAIDEDDQVGGMEIYFVRSLSLVGVPTPPTSSR